MHNIFTMLVFKKYIPDSSSPWWQQETEWTDPWDVQRTPRGTAGGRWRWAERGSSLTEKKNGGWGPFAAQQAVRQWAGGAYRIDALLPVGGAVAQQRGGEAHGVVQPAHSVHGEGRRRTEGRLERRRGDRPRLPRRAAASPATSPAAWRHWGPSYHSIYIILTIFSKEQTNTICNKSYSIIPKIRFGRLHKQIVWSGYIIVRAFRSNR